MLQHSYSHFLKLLYLLLILLCLCVGFIGNAPTRAAEYAGAMINPVFEQAARDYGMPASILKALCYMEGRLSNHGGQPSLDKGYGCMHLVQNKYGDTLTQAATVLGVSTDQLKNDIASNIRGGAAILRNYALQLSSSHTLPGSLNDWYGAVAAYSNASTHQTALMYADGLYQILRTGFRAGTESGEIVTLVPQIVRPNLASAHGIRTNTNLPHGCVNDGQTDYPGAINCIVDPHAFDCNIVPDKAPCTYQSANRPGNLAIDFIVIHDIEGSAQDGLNVFQDISKGVSIHYVVASDGSIYQLLREKDIAYHAGNFWYNQHSIGIEHAGFDATGFLWYNAAEYLASARLTAYLLKKYHLPLDHEHIVSHGTIPSPTFTGLPNHVDPGPFWLWDYYFKLIHEQGRDIAGGASNGRIVTLHPRSSKEPAGNGGTETAANFSFFYLYKGPDTRSGLIASNGTDITNELNNVEADTSYYYLSKVKDPAGTGDTMYLIWYGVENRFNEQPPDYFANGQTSWLAVPPGVSVEEGIGIPIILCQNGSVLATIYGQPVSDQSSVIGDVPNNATFVSGISLIEDGTTNLWYQITYNHRQAWVPASEVAPLAGN